MNYLSFLVKPASSLCNLKCPYCFYEDISNRRERPCSGKMKPEIMRKLIDRAIAETEEDAQITFAFQGGEPTLAGLEYYRQFTEYIREKKGARTVRYAIQTMVRRWMSRGHGSFEKKTFSWVFRWTGMSLTQTVFG